jgi:hypothetical protein
MRECLYGERAMISSSISPSFGTLGPVLVSLPMFWAHSRYQPLNHSLAHHPQVGQRKHHQQLAGVLGQPPVTRLARPKLILDHPKRMLHLGADTGFDLFNPISQGVAGFGLVQRLALARHHGNFPVHASVFVLNLLALFNAPVARVGKDHFLLSAARFEHATPASCINGHHQQGYHPLLTNALSPTSQARGVNGAAGVQIALAREVLPIWVLHPGVDHQLIRTIKGVLQKQQARNQTRRQGQAAAIGDKVARESLVNLTPIDQRSHLNQRVLEIKMLIQGIAKQLLCLRCR